MHMKMIYIFLSRVYIQNMGKGNAFREQINTNTLKNEMEAKEEASDVPDNKKVIRKS